MIGTSNWTPDYFLKTGGIGFVFSSNLKKEEYTMLSKGELKVKHRQPNKRRISHRLDEMPYRHNINYHGAPNYNANIANMHKQLNDVFLRDWSSPYTSEDI